MPQTLERKEGGWGKHANTALEGKLFSDEGYSLNLSPAAIMSCEGRLHHICEGS